MGRSVHGETRLNPEANNLRGKVVELRDQAGVVASGDYDFRGNLLSRSRKFLENYKNEIDWSQSPALEAEIFIRSTTYDALNRPTLVTTPDNSVSRPTFNEANLLEKVDVRLRGANDWTPFVSNIDYNAKGQRELIEYNNGASTTYNYDPQMFRLTRLHSTRAQGLNGISSKLFQDPAGVQDFNYTYDPSGNITRIRNNALPVLHYNNEQMAPISDFTYDAIYRLLAATGREHIGQAAFAPEPQTGNLRDYPFLGLAANPNDLRAMRNYTERYDYDAVGNFETMTHVAQNGNWTRNYHYNEPSLLEPAKISNCLSSTQVGNGPLQSYPCDVHGNIIEMPHLATMEWDFKDQLHATQQQVVNDGAGEKTYYIYDASGQRSRKVTERANGTKKKERLYLGGFELYRDYDGSGNDITLERETLHLMDDKERIALVETRTRGSEPDVPEQLIRFKFSNHLGSSSLELDNVGQIISYEEYYPYGSTSYQAGRSAAVVSLKRYRYTGVERDEESGLNYHGARYYALWLGRWASCDPIGIADGVNIYEYSHDNPVVNTDLHGTDAGGSGSNVVNYFLGVRNDLDKIEQECSTNSNSAQVFAVYHAILNQVEDAVLTGGGRLDLNGLWEQARRYDWDFPQRAWMDTCSACQERPSFSNRMKRFWSNRGFENVTGVNVEAVFNAVIKDEKPNPSRLERAIQFTAEAVILFGPMVGEGLTVGGLARSGLGAGGRAIAAEARAAGQIAAEARAAGQLELLRLNESGVPVQLHNLDTPIGRAYATGEEAVAAMASGGHVMEVVVRQRGGVVGNWWEISETGIGERGQLGHTEQKALKRIAYLGPDVSIEMRGAFPPCPYGGGCMNTLQLAAQTGARITYRQTNGATFMFQPE
jgi:RHS repeat-associated protein